MKENQMPVTLIGFLMLCVGVSSGQKTEKPVLNNYGEGYGIAW
jgi:hypothetical protein